ncbi:MAG TPA: response regulator [Flavitalea sp.]|nr:response regulator [Flavitalea sp.]
MPNRKNLVFIVDDDPDDRQIILDAFLENDTAMDYVFLENGKELMDALQECNLNGSEFPALILLDLNMPGMLGLQALKEIKGNESYKHIPTVILTTSALLTDRNSSFELGANCFITKPSGYGELVNITEAIGKMWFTE